MLIAVINMCVTPNEFMYTFDAFFNYVAKYVHVLLKMINLCLRPFSAIDYFFWKMFIYLYNIEQFF